MLHHLDKWKVNEIKNGNVASPIGFSAAGIHCGIRKKKLDLGLLLTEVPAVTAAVYTTNAFQAAPLQVTKQTLASSPMQRGLIVNSGNANAFTGKQGIEDALRMREAVAETFGMSPWEVLVASTGVIGEKLPIKKILSGINELPNYFSDEGGHAFSEAIMTTDTVIKSLAISSVIDGKKITIGGTAKGSGMIHPNMATMLGFISTDANIEKAALQRALSSVTNHTFNMITVDGDTSTNDMVTVMANGLAGNQLLDENHPEWTTFLNGLHYVAENLARMIAKDGEGATKLITVEVKGAIDWEMANIVAKKIVGSNLVKTAIFGSDGNWGRIVMAIGNSGYPFEEKSLDIAVGKITVVKQGQPQLVDEVAMKDYLDNEEIIISVHLHQGKESTVAWGCDLSYDYVRINASYRS